MAKHSRVPEISVDELAYVLIFFPGSGEYRNSCCIRYATSTFHLIRYRFDETIDILTSQILTIPELLVHAVYCINVIKIGAVRCNSPLVLQREVTALLPPIKQFKKKMS